MIIRTPIRPLYVSERSYAPHLFVIAVLWAAVMTLDYYDAEASAQEHQAMLIDCMNGVARWQAEDGTQIMCMKAVENPR